MTAARNSRRGGPPVYRQVESELLRRIREGELAPGSRLPTEPELAAEWGVNRLTIRQAIGELARAGHLTVRQGAGTFVAVPLMVIQFDLPRMPSTDADAGSTASLAEYVNEDQTETLVHLTDRDSDVAAAEALGSPGPFLRIDTLVRTREQPFLVAGYWLEAERFPGFTGFATGHRSERIALFQILRDHYDLRLRHDWRSLAAGVASREDATLLDIHTGSPVMYRDGVNVDDELRPTMYLRRRIRGDRIRFTLRYDTT
ncbi:GntR family transcriptional regulator [Pseudonocardia sp. GCM10023141]|uniref:GntR family transcriptional regulator n=1 Tax=Pseudonocardia sp. GCM10023141 TaxID=3252653 RepID=UPI00360ECA22